jgi:hypothetical protein
MTESELLKQRTKKQDMTGKDVKHLRRRIIELIVLVLEVGFMLAGAITGRNELLMIGWMLFALYFVLTSFRLIDDNIELAEENFLQSMNCIGVKYLLESTRMRLDGMSREEVKESLDAAIKMLDK